MYFRNRYDAAKQLIRYLKKYRNKDGVLLAIPRGGVPIGYYLAKELDMPLDLLMIKKLGHPTNPEYAIGAVSLDGYFIEDNREVSAGYAECETQRIRSSLKEKYKLFMGGKEPLDLKNKTVIIVDDGIATGRTIMVSINMLRKKNPGKIIIAVPVSSVQSANKLKVLVDDFICLYTPEEFYGVGMFYSDFSEVNDAEVISMLKELNHENRQDDNKKTTIQVDEKINS